MKKNDGDSDHGTAVSGLTEAPVRVGLEVELGADEARMVDIGVNERGHRRQAIVVRGSDGVARAWLNECQHLPIPLGVGTGAVLSDDRTHLICRTHGALYRRIDGYCVEGPCEGLSLTPLRMEQDSRGVMWIAMGGDLGDYSG